MRNLTQDTVIHCDSINYDVLCALAGTTNLGGIRNFTMRVRWRNYRKIAFDQNCHSGARVLRTASRDCLG